MALLNWFSGPSYLMDPNRTTNIYGDIRIQLCNMRKFSNCDHNDNVRTGYDKV